MFASVLKRSVYKGDGVLDSHKHLHGVAGSGHGGQFVPKDTPVASSEVSNNVLPKKSTQEDISSLSTDDQDHFRGVRIVCDDVADALKYPKDKISYSPEIKHFNIGEKQYRYAGAARLSTGEIIMYPLAINSTNDAEGFMAHEIGHHDFEKVETIRKEERKKVMADPDTYISMKPDGTLRPGSKSELKYPLYARLAPLLDTPSAMDKLYKDDGCTEYSKSWWRSFRLGKVDSGVCFHETFAEIHRLAYEAKRDKKSLSSMGVKPTWRRLYTEYQKILQDYKHGS